MRATPPPSRRPPRRTWRPSRKPGRDRPERSSARLLPERERGRRHRRARARLARAARAQGRGREARRPARQPGRADRRAQPRPAPLGAGLLLRRPQAARQPRRPGGAGAAGRPARARAGGGGRHAPALRAGARGRPADPAELPAQGASRPARLADRGLLPPRARGGRRLLRRDPAARRTRRLRRRRRDRQGRARRARDVRHPQRAARLGPAPDRARRGARARQRAPLPRHAGEDVRDLPLRRARPGHRAPALRERGPRPALREDRRRRRRAARTRHAARPDAGHVLRGEGDHASARATASCCTPTVSSRPTTPSATCSALRGSRRPWPGRPAAGS